MFDRNKRNSADETPAPATPYQSAPPPVADTKPTSVSTPPVTRRRDAAVIGASIQIEGHLRGQEDLIVEGEVNGTINLANHTLTIGSQAKIKANVFAHTVFVDGAMDGDVFGSEQVTVRKSARVKGNITSPRVSLEDGASFKGSIEMDADAVKAAIGSVSTSTSSSPGSRAPAAFTPAQSKVG